MSRLHPFIAALALNSATLAWAAAPALEATTGLPQLATGDGQNVAWRYLSVRASTPTLSFEMKVPTCIDPLRAAVDSSQLGRPLGCQDGRSLSALGQFSQKFSTTWRLPRLVPDGPAVDVAIRAWGVPGSEHGLSSGIELTQMIGAAKLAVGHSAPLRIGRSGEAWRSTYGGVSWRPAPRQMVELSFDQSREVDSGARDRQFKAVYSTSRSAGQRWRIGLTRSLDDPSGRWSATLGAEWKF